MAVPDPSAKKPGSRFLGSAGALLLVAAVFLAGVWVGGHPRETGLDRLRPTALRDLLVSSDRIAVATEVLGILDSDYYRPLDPAVIEKAQDASATALVQAIGDPYSEYLSREAYHRFLNQRAGTYVGVGVEWKPDGNAGRILRVTPGGPADRAGLRPADAIVAVDGKAVRASDQYAAMATVKGEEGTRVALTVVRAKQPRRTYTMVRAEIQERVVDARIEETGRRRVGYVRLDRFTTGAAKVLRAAVDGFETQDVSAVLLDLRGDPGGLVDEAVDVVGVFLPDGSQVARTRGRDGESETLRTDDNPAIDVKIPLIVLVDRNSASASEIVAGALRDGGRARLIGDRTFGKALIQTTRTLPSGAALKYTTASYLTPSGFDLGKRGLKPDVRVVDRAATSTDEVLQAALRLVGAR